MGSNQLVSIIVPVYNSQQTLAKCVESLLNQDYTNIEIILVDDGSKDDSLSICKIYETKDHRVKVVTQKNSGVSSARNNGIKNSNGEWICFVDSDDYVDISYISDFGLDDINGSLTLYLQGYQHNYENNKEVVFVHEDCGAYDLKREADVLFETTNFVNQGTVCSKLYNRNVITNNSIEFNKRMRLNEDNCFFWDYVSKIEKVVIKETCGYHYMHAEGINYSKSHKNYKEYIFIMQENKEKLNHLYNTFAVQHNFYYSKNYNQFVVNSWLHGLVAFFLEPTIASSEFEEVLSYSNELKNYSPKGLLLNTLKQLLRFLLLLPSKAKIFSLKLFSRWIYKAKLFSI